MDAFVASKETFEIAFRWFWIQKDDISIFKSVIWMQKFFNEIQKRFKTKRSRYDDMISTFLTNVTTSFVIATVIKKRDEFIHLMRNECDDQKYGKNHDKFSGRCFRIEIAVTHRRDRHKSPIETIVKILNLKTVVPNRVKEGTCSCSASRKAPAEQMTTVIMEKQRIMILRWIKESVLLVNRWILRRRTSLSKRANRRKAKSTFQPRLVQSSNMDGLMVSKSTPHSQRRRNERTSSAMLSLNNTSNKKNQHAVMSTTREIVPRTFKKVSRGLRGVC